MYLCVEERDYAGCAGSGISVGWTHYFEYPSMEKVYDFFHGEDSLNDSGQSYCIGSIQYQINCIFGGSNLFIYEKDSNILIEKRNLTCIDGEQLRILGITGAGNVLYLGAMNYPSYDKQGIFTYEIDDTLNTNNRANLRLTLTSVPSGLSRKGNILYYVSQDDDQLHIVDISGNPVSVPDAWWQYSAVTLPEDGVDHYRGCIVIGSEIIVGNVTACKLHWINLNSYTEVSQFDFSSYLHDQTNKLYGVWKTTQDGLISRFF